MPQMGLFYKTLNNKYQAVSQGARRFGKRSLFGSYVSIYKSGTTPDHGF
jgi:hypothetical protein